MSIGLLPRFNGFVDARTDKHQIYARGIELRVIVQSVQYACIVAES
jgi:hypothetical protein